MDQIPESADALPRGLFQALLRQSVDAIVLLERDSRRFVEFSDSWCGMTGFTREELLGRTAAQLGITKPEEQAPMRQSIAASREGVVEVRMWRRDGQLRWVGFSTQRLEPNLDLTLVRDITDRHALHEMAQRYQLLVESVRDYGIFLLDPEGRVVSWNEGARRIKGHEADEIIGRHFSVFYPPEDTESGKPTQHLQKAVADGRLEDEGWRLRKDGSRFWANVVINPLRDASGQLTGFANVTRDVTEKLELRSQRAMRLESLGQLAGGVAHDFNNLLAVILNVTARLKAELEGTATHEIADLPDAARELARIDKAANSASRLTRQLLTFARRQVAQPVVIDPNAEITGSLDLLRRTLGSHIKVSSDLAPDVWNMVMDPGQFEQVVVNLAVNARDAMPKGGALSISTANVTIDQAFAKARPGLEPGRYVRIQVGDTGTGMDKTTLAHVFEPFFTTKPAGHGTGLGLATIYGIVQQADGHVAIYSEPGLGTNVTVFIPATDSELSVAAPTDITVTQKRRGGTVLLVEDYQDLRELFVEILEGAGYRVLAAPDGAVALSVAREHAGEIDVLLSDIVMPNMLGTDLAETLRAENPHLRVVFMSGYAQPALGSNAVIPVDVPLLQKPLMQNELLAKLEQVLSTSR